jgi:tetratricopeptide (TPR) repeat protein
MLCSTVRIDKHSSAKILNKNKMRLLKNISWLSWIVAGIFILISAATAGLGLGYVSGENAREMEDKIADAVDIQTQFELGKRDFDAGNYDLARQRLEYVIQKDPDYPGANELLEKTLEQMVEVIIQVTVIVQASATPTPDASPTPDTRAVDEIYTVAQKYLREKDWEMLIQTILSLRDSDPGYQVNMVDRFLYVALYFRGSNRIIDLGDLEGGLYDLSLAEQFAPLDSIAEVYRGWARLYQIGMSFWAVYPDQSVYYFSQLAAAAPYLHDLSGVPAINRYRMALVQYGDSLVVGEDWCGAADQYNLAQGIFFDQAFSATVSEIKEKCQFSIATPTLTPTPTFTPTLTPTPGLAITQTPSFTPSQTPLAETTETLTPEPTITVTIPGTPSPSLSPTVTLDSPTPSPILPTNTPTATQSTLTPSATDPDPTVTQTPSPSPTFTSTIEPNP